MDGPYPSVRQGLATRPHIDIEPAKVIESEDIPMLAYRGKEGCTSMWCTRIYDNGYDQCYGWHCAKCDQPSSAQGHSTLDGGWTCPVQPNDRVT